MPATKKATLGSAKEQAKEVFKHVARLKYQDEDWQTREEALQRLQLLITAGALSTEAFVLGEAGFAANLKDLVHSLVAQLYDLRSVIVKSAVKTLSILCTEMGDHADAERPLLSEALEGFLQLTSSGNKVLSAAGREAFPHFIDTVRFESIIGASPEGLLHWLRGMKNPPVKLCCLSSILQALRTWPLSLLKPLNESLEVALIEAAAHPTGEVRVLARQCLLQHLVNVPERQGEVDRWLGRYPDTKKQLEKEQPQPGALPPDERVQPRIRHGEAGARKRNGKLGGEGSPDESLPGESCGVESGGADGGASSADVVEQRVGAAANTSQSPAGSRSGGGAKKRSTSGFGVGGGKASAPPAGLAERLASKQPPSLSSGKGSKSLGSSKEQAKEIFKHCERLKYQDEDWQARDDALSRLQLLISGGALASDEFVSGEARFAANLKDLVHSIVTQLFDLRSVVARSAATTLELLMLEVGDHASAEGPMREDALEGLLKLACSGNKVLAATAKEVFPEFVDAVRFESLVREGLLHWLRGNKQVPVKLCCLSSILQALRTWPLSLLKPLNESLEVALIEAAAHPTGEVRVLARQCLLQHLVNVPERQGEVDRWLGRYPDTKKQLEKEQPQPGALPPDERVQPRIRQGESGAKTRNGKLGKGASDVSPASASDGVVATRPAGKPLKKQGSMSKLASAFSGSVKSVLKGGTAAVMRTATRERSRSQAVSSAGLPPAPVAQVGGEVEKVEKGDDDAEPAVNMAAAPSTHEQGSWGLGWFGGSKTLDTDDSGSIDATVSAAPSRSALERMKEAKELFDAGLLNQDEYDAKRAAIVSQI